MLVSMSIPENDYNDILYKEMSISSKYEHPDVLGPDIRTNIYSNIVDYDIYYRHMGLIGIVRKQRSPFYKLNIKEEGLLIVNTYTFKNTDLTKVGRLLKHYQAQLSELVRSELIKLVENHDKLTNKLVVRIIYFVNREVFDKYNEAIDIKGMLFAVKPEMILEESEHKTMEDKDMKNLATIGFVVNHHYGLFDKVKLKLFKEHELEVPVVADKNRTEGIYMLHDNKWVRISDIKVLELEKELEINKKELRDAIEKYIRKEINSVLVIRDNIRKLVNTKYKALFELLASREKFFHELKLMELKGELEIAKHNAEVRALNAKHNKNLEYMNKKIEVEESKTFTSFIKDIFKAIF